MASFLRMRAAVCLLVLLAGPVGAEVITWSADDPFESTDVITIDLGVALEGVQRVEIRAVGVGGRQAYSCVRYPGDSGIVGKYLDLHLAVPDGETEGLAAASCYTWYPDPYGTTMEAIPTAGHEDWDFMANGVFTLTKSASHPGYPYPHPWCYGIIPNESPTVERLELTITVDSFVPAAMTTWGTIKAAYR